jgi:three-Cys-motif partner protein
MIIKDPDIVKEPHAEWGGTWTEKKLDAFAKYVKAYLTIMNKHPELKTVYFDGFAGSGERKNECDTDLLRELPINIEELKVYKGAAERVLSLPENFSFFFYYFIDSNCASLDKLKQKLSPYQNTKRTPFQFRKGDCNIILGELTIAMHKDKKLASLVFLDPFGMQVNWNSIENLSGTRTDLWLLVPTGLIVNRLLDRNGELKHAVKLESFFGLSEEEIRDYFYTRISIPTLFGEQELIRKVTKPIEKIAELYVIRLKSKWKFVTEKPLKLINSRNVPIFHLVFASNNSTGLKIANQIIETI